MTVAGGGREPDRVDGTTFARALSEFLTRTGYEDIPPLALDHAAMLVSSTVASAAKGSTLESSRIVRSLLLQRGGAAEATLWFQGAARLPVASAARVNALMSDAAASDDSDLRNATHPGTTLVATSLAMAEKTGAGGKDILRAIVLGYEAAGRINTGVLPGLVSKKFHGSVITIFGGAIAAGLLLGLDTQRMTQALALAATSVGGLLAAAKTSTAREHHAGLSAMLGVEAAQLAGLGYTAEEAVFEHPTGFFSTYGDAEPSGRVAAAMHALGQEWQILTHMAIKLVPGGHPHHVIAEAAAQASRMANVPASEITAVICSRPGMRSFPGSRHPTDLIGVAHSPIYFAAAGAADGEFTWAHASEEKIMDPRIRRLLDLVEVGEPPAESAQRHEQSATVTVRTRDGRRFTSTVDAPRGSAINGIEWHDVEAKFAALCPCAGVSASNVARCTRVLRHFREIGHAREFIDLIG